jgi:hypothetical protein
MALALTVTIKTKEKSPVKTGLFFTCCIFRYESEYLFAAKAAPTLNHSILNLSPSNLGLMAINESDVMSSLRSRTIDQVSTARDSVRNPPVFWPKKY